MATNFIRDGATIRHTETPAVSSGEGVIIGAMLGVAINDIAANTEGEYSVMGVYEMPKLTANVMAVGDVVNWNDSNKEFQNATSDLDGVGVVWKASDGSTTTVQVKLNQAPA